MSTARIAVLVDGDNISHSFAPMILAKASTLGRIDIARSYVNGSNPSDWLSKPGFEGRHAGAGKNSADILLCIEAMELALVHGIEIFLIATSDGDFSHLAFRLREFGVLVHGVGEVKAPDGFRMACSIFTELAPKVAKPKPVPVAAPNPPKAISEPCCAADLDHKIRVEIREHSVGGCGMRIEHLSTVMRQKHGTLISQTPERSWRNYLNKRPELYDVDPRGPEAMVKFKPAGFR